MSGKRRPGLGPDSPVPFVRRTCTANDLTGRARPGVDLGFQSESESESESDVSCLRASVRALIGVGPGPAAPAALRFLPESLLLPQPAHKSGLSVSAEGSACLSLQARMEWPSVELCPAI